jgi:hypothetical protein
LTITPSKSNSTAAGQFSIAGKLVSAVEEGNAFPKIDAVLTPRKSSVRSNSIAQQRATGDEADSRQFLETIKSLREPALSPAALKTSCPARASRSYPGRGRDTAAMRALHHTADLAHAVGVMQVTCRSCRARHKKSQEVVILPNASWPRAAKSAGVSL